MDVLTDNKNRTVAEIRHLMTKFGGNLGENGSVSWMFEKLGQIIIKTESINEENLFNDALHLGAEDFSKDDSDFIVTSNPSLTAEIAEGLEKKGYELISSKIEMVPKILLRFLSQNLQSFLI